MKKVNFKRNKNTKKNTKSSAVFNTVKSIGSLTVTHISDAMPLLSQVNANIKVVLNTTKYTSMILNNGFSTLNNSLSSLVSFTSTTLNDHILNS